MLLSWRFLCFFACLVALIVLFYLVVVSYSVSSYSPLWVDRSSPGGVALDSAEGASGDSWGSLGVFVVAPFYYEATGTRNSSVLHYGVGGSLDSYSFIVAPPSYDIVLQSIASGPSYVYAAGYRYDGRVYNATIVALDKTSLDLVYYSLLSFTDSSTYYGVCVGGDGSVYTVGRSFVGNDYGVLVAAFSEDLSLVNAASYTITDGSGNIVYNATGYSCVIGPDGYLYVASLIFWWSSGYNYNFPVYLALLKIDPSSLDIVTYKLIELYNSQGYVTSASNVHPGIGATDSNVVVAASYTDELPSATSPTSGGMILVLDTELNTIARRNLTTEYHERFSSIVVGGEGEIVVGGDTQNDYGSGLGTSGFHGLLLLLTSSLGVSKAILQGNSSYYNSVFSVTIGSGGVVYGSGYDESDNTLFYDVTSSLSLSLENRSGSAIVARGGGWLIARIKPPSPSSLVLKSLGGRGTAYSPEGAIIAHSYSGLRPAETPSGDSSAIVVAYNERVTPPDTPPPPIPEPWLLIVFSISATMLGLLVLNGRKKA